jgi:hypothetical protein
MKYGAFESHPVMYDEREGWVLFDTETGDWRKLQLAEIMLTTRPMSEAEFTRPTESSPRCRRKLFLADPERLAPIFRIIIGDLAIDCALGEPIIPERNFCSQTCSRSSQKPTANSSAWTRSVPS